jgi:hypothetical protein
MIYHFEIFFIIQIFRVVKHLTIFMGRKVIKKYELQKLGNFTFVQN